MSQRNPGPNDFHFEQVDGEGLVMKPGLGDDEPDEMTSERVRRESDENARREAALNRAADELAKEAEILERQKQDLEDRERRIADRERALREATGTSTSSSEPRRTTARLATERSTERSAERAAAAE